ncbi:MAG: FHA domain-containing protein [Planctomycetota bacterium]|jgi:hypothetical protein|nr:FHA domain-containing protein [Planctomycetota bacterium]
MTSRFQLRFLDGERAGETIPLTQSPMSVGRKPGVHIQLTDSSVSGGHAELTVSGEEVNVRDLGSTNGTRVAGRVVQQAQALAHGDEVRFGQVGLVFEDGSFSSGSAAAAAVVGGVGAEAGVGGEGDDLGRISSQALERAGKGSRLYLLLGAVALSAGGAWYYFGQEGGAASAGTRPVVAVAGNLLEGSYSFEGEGAAWEADEAGPAAFFVGSGESYSGAAALSVELGEGEWARHYSEVVSVRGQKQLTLRAWTRGEGELEGALGLEFQGSGVEVVTAWTALALAGSFEQGVLTCAVPPGVDSVRAFAMAEAKGVGGSLVVDDVVLVPGAGEGAGAASPLTVAEYKLHLLGAPTSSALLHKAGRTFVTDLRLEDAGAGSGGGRPLALAVSAQSSGLEIGLDSAGHGAGDAVLMARLEPGAMGASVATVGGGSQTGTGGGYRTHAIDFERPGVTSLLTGKGLDLLRWKFSEPVDLRGAVVGQGLEISARLPAGARVFLQLSFRDERLEAGNLAHEARNSERAGAIGACLTAWQRLLDEYPFEEGLVAEAEESRGRLVSAGMAELTDLERRVERARFFALADLFRRCRGAAEEISRTYTGSEVELAAERLTDAINGDLLLLDSGRDAGERERLRAILTVLEGREADELASALRNYMEEQYGEAE